MIRLSPEYGFVTLRGIYARRELRSIASLANREDGARCHARWPRVRRAARRRSPWLARVLLFGVGSNRVQSNAGRGGTGVGFNPSGSAWSHVPYLALFAGAASVLASRNANLLNLTSPAAPARRPFRFYESSEEASPQEWQPQVWAKGCARPEWPHRVFAATRCWLCRCRARPGGTRSCDRYRGSLRREPCCRP